MISALLIFILFSLPATQAAILPVGCYTNEPSSDDIMKLAFQQENGLTVAVCGSFCRGKGKAYAGLMAGTACYCADEFGLTDAVVSCNYTCADGNCGGPSSYEVYYVIDPANNDKRKLKLNAESNGFYEARKACILMDGDLVGREIMSVDVVAELNNLVPNANPSDSKIWLGLRKRRGAYEWVDEREPSASNTYARMAFEFVSMWVADDADKECVTYDIGLKQLASSDCTGTFKSVCDFFNDTSKVPQDPTKQLTQDDDTQGDDKTLALFIVLPLFLICYGGACILYCIHKILKHCCKRGTYSQHVKLQQKSPSRLPTAKKNAVHPFPESLSHFSPMMMPMTAAEEKKLKLLENASREAMSRREPERVASGRSKGQPDEPESRPLSTRSTGRLLPPMSMQRPPLPSSQAGLSINEILRNKMEQQANKKKPKRIIAT